MKCKEMPQHLVSLLYGEISTQDKKKIKTHMTSCDACREAYEEIADTSRILTKWEDLDPRMHVTFVREQASTWQSVKKTFNRWSLGRRLIIGIPAFAAAE